MLRVDEDGLRLALAAVLLAALGCVARPAPGPRSAAGPADSAPRATSPGGPGEVPPDGPYLLLLGTAQDAGLPQIGCPLACCRAAREDPARRRLVASLLLADPRDGRRWLIDATPDLREQVERARGHPPRRRSTGPRPPLFDGAFLTHAHLGHVAGLLQFGPEANAAHALPAFVSPTMAAFLAGNAPWSLLVDAGHLSLRPFVPLAPDLDWLPLVAPRDGRAGAPVPEALRAAWAAATVALAPDLAVTAVTVPHRDESSDTVGFLIAGPHRVVLYLPDIDRWEDWVHADGRELLAPLLRRVDLALLDGTFFADGEIPGRSMAAIPHPRITDTLARWSALPPDARPRLLFTHLNHTNPAADPESARAATVRAAGGEIAAEGMLLGL